MALFQIVFSTHSLKVNFVIVINIYIGEFPAKSKAANNNCSVFVVKGQKNASGSEFGPGGADACGRGSYCDRPILVR